MERMFLVAGRVPLALGLLAALFLLGCGGGGGGLKLPPATTTNGTPVGGGGGTTGGTTGLATLVVDGAMAATARTASAAGACAVADDLPFRLSAGALAQCSDAVSGPGATLSVSYTAGGKTVTGDFSTAAGLTLRDLPAGQGTLSVWGNGINTLTVAVELVGDLTLHARAVPQGATLDLYGVYSGSKNPTVFRDHDQRGFWARGTGEVLRHSDNGVTFLDNDGSGTITPGDDVFYDQDFDGVDDELDDDDDNDGIPDAQDLDDDNDGVADTTDTSDTDDDNDGQSDGIDPDDGDADNDGIPDAQDTVADPFITTFSVTVDGAPVSTAVVGQPLTLAAAASPAGTPVRFEASGGTINGATWTLPTTPGRYLVQAIVNQPGVSVRTRRTYRVLAEVGSAVAVVHDPAGITLGLGQTYPLNFQVKDQLGNMLAMSPALSVSGSAVTLAGTSITAQAPGTATVTATLGGLTGTLSVNVPDTQAPVVTLNDTVPATTIDPTVTLVGFVSDESVTQVVVTGGVQTVTLPVANGFFSGPVDIPIGSVTLTVTATDTDNNTGTATVNVVRQQDQLPQLVLTPLAELTIGSSATVGGTLTDNNTTQVTVTGEGGFSTAVSLGSGGAFSVIVPLVIGMNTLTVAAEDAVGNAVSGSLLVTRLEGGLNSFASDKTGQTLGAGQVVTLTLDAGSIQGASASAVIPAFNLTVPLKDDGVAPDTAVDGRYTGQFTTPAAGPFGAISATATLTDDQGVSGELTADSLFTFDVRPVVGSLTCDCAGQTKKGGDVVTFTLSASAWPGNGTATLTLNSSLGAVSLTDGNADGQYVGTFTVPQTGSGLFGGTLTFTDVLGNVRTTALSNLIDIDNKPVCTTLTHTATGTLQSGDVVHVRVGCGALQNVFLSFTNGVTSIVSGLQLLDNGQGADAVAGDQVFEADVTMPACTEIAAGQIKVTVTDPLGNFDTKVVGNPIVVSQEPVIASFNVTISSGATLPGGTPFTMTLVSADAGGTATVTLTELSQTYTLADQGGGTYSSTQTLPLTGTVQNVDVRATFANSACPAIISDPFVLVDHFHLDNTPVLTAFTHDGQGGTVFTGGQSWHVSIEGPENAASASAQIVGLPTTYAMAQTVSLGGGRARYEATVTLPGSGSVDGADVKVTLTDTLGNTGIATSAASMTLDNTPPPQVSDLAAAAGSSLVRLTWTRPSADVVAYRILRSAENLNDFTHSVVLSSSVSSVVYDDPSVAVGSPYAYKVIAIDRVALESPESAEVAVTTGLPSAPTLNRPVPRGTNDGGGLRLTWAAYAGEPTITSVKVYRALSSSVGSTDPLSASTVVFSDSLAVFDTTPEIIDAVPDKEAVYYYRAEVTTTLGDLAVSPVVSQSVSAVWQVYFDVTMTQAPALIRRLTGGNDANPSGGTDNTLAGTVHYRVVTDMNGITASSSFVVDAARGVMLLSRPTAGTVSVLDLGGNTVGTLTGLSNPTLLALHQANGLAYVVTGSGPYSLRQITFTMPSAPTSGPFGTTVTGEGLSLVNTPRGIAVDPTTGRVLVEGVESSAFTDNNNNNSVLTQAFGKPFPFVHTPGGNGNLTASENLSSVAAALAQGVNPRLTLLITVGNGPIAQPNPLELSISINGKPVKRVVWVGAGTTGLTSVPLQFDLPAAFFKWTSQDVIEIANLSAHVYGGRIGSADACPADWCIANNLGNQLILRVTAVGGGGAPLGNVTLRSIGVYEPSGTEMGWISGALDAGRLGVTSNGNLFIAENWEGVGASASSNRAFAVLQSGAFTNFRTNPVFDGGGNPVGQNRQFFDLNARNDYVFRRQGVPLVLTPKRGWINPSRLHLSTSNAGASWNLWLSAPLYRFANATAYASRQDGGGATLPSVVVRCSAAETTGCSTDGVPNWMYVGFEAPGAIAHDTVNNRVYVCDAAATPKLYVFHDADQALPGGCPNGDDYSACNNVGTPTALFKALAGNLPGGDPNLDPWVGNGCELAVARP